MLLIETFILLTFAYPAERSVGVKSERLTEPQPRTHEVKYSFLRVHEEPMSGEGVREPLPHSSNDTNTTAADERDTRRNVTDLLPETIEEDVCVDG